MHCAEQLTGCDARVLFVAAAGPRRGFGHLVRSISFARALGVRPLLALRGGPRVEEAALALGADVLAAAAPRILQAIRPDVVIVDDPVARAARRWMAAARKAGALVVSVHDLGLGCRESDLLIDGSITRAKRLGGGRPSLTGSRFALLDPAVRAAAMARRTVQPRRVLISLGGGPRVRLAGAIADAIVALAPDVEVRIAGGFVVAPRTPQSKVVWIGATRGLAGELSQTATAVLAGGVSLYEACALGVPTVSLPVVTGQIPTVRAFARKRAVVAAPFGASAHDIAARTVSLLNEPARQRSLARRARSLVDGHGASRAAATVVALSRARRARAWERL